MRLAKRGTRYILHDCPFALRKIPQDHGFLWDPVEREWYTESEWSADRIRAVPQVVSEEPRGGPSGPASEASHPNRRVLYDGLVDHVGLYPFQADGVRWLVEHPSALLADEMGLGKTVQTLALIDYLKLERVLVVCPAGMVLTWGREARKWLPQGPAPTVLSYDMLHKRAAELREKPYDLLVLDECQAVKNPKTRRSQQVLGSRSLAPIPATRRLYLSGTPMLNRPSELWPILHSLAPREFASRSYFYARYCDPILTQYGTRLGATRIAELGERMRATVMLRRTKSEVLTELPEKRRQIVTLGTDSRIAELLADEYRAHERTTSIPWVDPRTPTENNPNPSRALFEARANLAKRRQAVGVAKVPYAIEHLRDATASHKVVAFAYHRAVLDALHAAFYGFSVLVTGDTPLRARQHAVDTFQTDSYCTLFLGQIEAAGVGITLTAASHVVFVELDWVPARLTQAEDRCHRIGQRDAVLVQHLVFEGSLDERMLDALISKQQLTERLYDDPS